MSGAGKVMIFARHPEPGAVKTRLEKDFTVHVGQKHARALTLALYEAFVQDTVEGVRNAAADGDTTVRVCFDPPEAAASMRQWLGVGLEYAPQQGGGLGARMAHAFTQAFEDARIPVDRAVLMGSDIPDYPPQLVMQALEALAPQGRADAAIAPSLDGGYFLIGFRKTLYHSSFFEELAWGTDSVYQQTLGMLQKAGLRVEILPTWNDIDHGRDALATLMLHGDDAFSSSRTFALLNENRSLLERFDLDAPCMECGDESLHHSLLKAWRVIQARIVLRA